MAQRKYAVGTYRKEVIDMVMHNISAKKSSEAVADGIAQSEAIWQTYTDGLKAL